MSLNNSFKIVFFTFYYEPDLCAGSFRATAFTEALKKQFPESTEITVITTVPNRYESFEVECLNYEEQGNVKIHRIPIPSHKSGLIDQANSFRKYFFAALSIIRKQKFDLVIGTSSRLFTAFLSSYVSRKLNIPLYLDIRDIFRDTMNEVLKSKLLKLIALPIMKVIETYSFGRASHINLVSEGFRGYFEDRFDKSYTYFTNGIDPEFLKNDFKKETKSEKPIITYAGNIGEGQGLHTILPKAAKELENEYKFRIIGAGGAILKLREEILKINPTNIELIEPVNRKELLKYYKQSDFMFLHLNDFKAFEKVLPSKIFEYVATKKPIIAGVAGYASKFLNDNVPDSIVFKPGNVKEFVEKLRNYKIQILDRSDFIENFERTKVMSKMAQDIKSRYVKN